MEERGRVLAAQRFDALRRQDEEEGKNKQESFKTNASDSYCMDEHPIVPGELILDTLVHQNLLYGNKELSRFVQFMTSRTTELAKCEIRALWVIIRKRRQLLKTMKLAAKLKRREREKRKKEEEEGEAVVKRPRIGTLGGDSWGDGDEAVVKRPRIGTLGGDSWGDGDEAVVKRPR
eukprot:CAMPEP_0175058426 /NCGR_PEP_ID=MMETSP0052_2-20121109/11841_1 /TAXON_ID=51329 ORGANISM="Polytomella parva, Strain SAG 63-3" /NCGR_SAMPLE_ID=MMETSP0052_2 /ASSEMBLY_ACC=CAM_ASM_000194 /LENGTH=175 /DNA_ID=CAMNT_0016323805 /DNA_START=561 /DNA_END=1085 /DNA_ORIENTATION=+